MTIIYEFAGDETPQGILDGKNPTFTLARTPNPLSGLQLFRNGLIMKRGADYQIVNNVVTFVPAAIPQAHDILTAFYRY